MTDNTLSAHDEALLFSMLVAAGHAPESNGPGQLTSFARKLPSYPLMEPHHHIIYFFCISCAVRETADLTMPICACDGGAEHRARKMEALAVRDAIRHAKDSWWKNMTREEQDREIVFARLELGR